MKKTLCKILATSLTGVMLLSATALAAPSLNVVKKGDALEVTVTGLSASEESTLLAVRAGTALSALEANEAAVFYIDQTTANADGTASYEFSIDGAGDLDVYSGYEKMTADAEPMKEPVKQQETGGNEPSNPDTGDFIYGDVNNDGDIDTLDAAAVIDYWLDGTGFIDMNTETAYEYGEQAADVTGDTDIDTLDAAAIIDYWLDGTELPINVK